jgi:hypothetical protein
MPTGSIGMYGHGGFSSFLGFHTYERDDTPPLE